jgi:hypothetical protein
MQVTEYEAIHEINMEDGMRNSNDESRFITGRETVPLVAAITIYMNCTILQVRTTAEYRQKFIRITGIRLINMCQLAMTMLSPTIGSFWLVEGKKSCVGLAIFKNHWTVAINNQF